MVYVLLTETLLKMQDGQLNVKLTLLAGIDSKLNVLIKNSLNRLKPKMWQGGDIIGGFIGRRMSKTQKEKLKTSGKGGDGDPVS